MTFTKPTTAEWIIGGVIVATLVAVAPFRQTGVWDGHFPLTLEIREREPVDRQSLSFATCWSQEEADLAVAHPEVREWTFHPPEFDDGRAVIHVRSSGRIGWWGMLDTYNHPKYLIVEYRLASADDDAPVARKAFPIPTGRGPRSMTIELP